MIDNINNILQQILNDFLAASSELIFSAKIIAGIGAIILAFITFRKMQMEGNTEAMNGFFIKLFLVAIGIGFYGTFISFINAPLNIVSANVKQISHEQYEETTNVFTEMYENPGGSGSVNNEQYDSEIQTLLGEDDQSLSSDNDSVSIYNMVQNTSEFIHGVFFQVVFQILSFIASIALVILNVVRTFFLIVLSLFGVFVIAISIYPSLEGSFGQWLQKYINVYLWLPIAYILDGVLSKIFMYHQESNALDPGSLPSYYMVNLLALCTIISYATVPTMSSWIVNASTNAMASKVKGKGEGMVSAAKKAGEAKMSGGTSLAKDAAKTAAPK